MSSPDPQLLAAGVREAGARCPHCQIEVREGDDVAVCRQCGAVNHRACWLGHDGRCGSFDCAPARRTTRDLHAPVLRISADEVDRAVPLPSARPQAPGPMPYFPATSASPRCPPPTKARTSKLAVAAFIVALAGIPLFGLLTGLVAVVLGSIALGGIQQSRQRGTFWAMSAVLLGLMDVVGWVIFLAAFLPGQGRQMTLDDFEPDMAAMENLSPHIRQAVQANVLIESQRARGIFRGKGVGSGVILRIRDGAALIVTNRHVVDPDFADEPSQTARPAPGSVVGIKLVGQPTQPATVVWVAPDGIDLALVNVSVLGGQTQAQAASWQANRRLIVGEDVFCIGNPQHLDWSHTRGSISQLRFQNRGARKIHVIQTDAAINPGNSGGGLYDKQGQLIGINTWTNDKRVSEGISFAIAFQTLLDLDPPPLREAGP